jgi:transposase-like protein
MYLTHRGWRRKHIVGRHGAPDTLERELTHRLDFDRILEKAAELPRCREMSQSAISVGHQTIKGYDASSPRGALTLSNRAGRTLR